MGKLASKLIQSFKIAEILSNKFWNRGIEQFCTLDPLQQIVEIGHSLPAALWRRICQPGPVLLLRFRIKRAAAVGSGESEHHGCLDRVLQREDHPLTCRRCWCRLYRL